jgi:hypothetical protein
MQLRILTRFDFVRDRLSHFYHWNDYTALNAAVGVAAQGVDEVDLDRLRAWTAIEGPGLAARLAEFERRLERILEAGRAT